MEMRWQRLLRMSFFGKGLTCWRGLTQMLAIRFSPDRVLTIRFSPDRVLSTRISMPYPQPPRLRDSSRGGLNSPDLPHPPARPASGGRGAKAHSHGGDGGRPGRDHPGSSVSAAGKPGGPRGACRRRFGPNESGPDQRLRHYPRGPVGFPAALPVWVVRPGRLPDHLPRCHKWHLAVGPVQGRRGSTLCQCVDPRARMAASIPPGAGSLREVGGSGGAWASWPDASNPPSHHGYSSGVT